MYFTLYPYTLSEIPDRASSLTLFTNKNALRKVRLFPIVTILMKSVQYYIVLFIVMEMEIPFYKSLSLSI